MTSRIAIISLLVIVSAQAQQLTPSRHFVETANAHYTAGRYTDAIALLDSALAIQRHEFILFQKGLALQKLGRDAQAISVLREAIALHPAFAAGLHALATSLYKMRRFDSAAICYEMALEENPKLHPARTGLLVTLTTHAQSTLSSGDTVAATRLAIRALALDSSAAEPRLILARTYNMSRRSREALRECDVILALPGGTQRSAAFFEQGLALRNLSETERARLAFSEARKDNRYTAQADAELQRLDALGKHPGPGADAH